jgi:hypothetical protein
VAEARANASLSRSTCPSAAAINFRFADCAAVTSHSQIRRTHNLPSAPPSRARRARPIFHASALSAFCRMATCGGIFQSAFNGCCVQTVRVRGSLANSRMRALLFFRGCLLAIWIYAYCSCFTRPCCGIQIDGGGARRCIIIPQNLPQRGRDQLVVRRLQPALRAAITMDSWYSALGARPFSTCCPTLRTTRATRRPRAAPRVQRVDMAESSLICTGIARCTTHNASQRICS